MIFTQISHQNLKSKPRIDKFMLKISVNLTECDSCVIYKCFYYANFWIICNLLLKLFVFLEFAVHSYYKAHDVGGEKNELLIAFKRISVKRK